MKKLIFILLIAIIVCKIIEDDQPLKESASSLDDLLAMIEADGTGPYLREILYTKGKIEAYSECERLYPDYWRECYQALSSLH